MAITINGSGTITGISAGGLPDGSVTAADIESSLDLSGKTVTLPAGTGGKVLQVVQTVTSSAITYSTSGSWTNISQLNTSITPSSTSSKILMQVSLSFDSENNYPQYVHYYRDSTKITPTGTTGPNGGDSYHSYMQPADTRNWGHVSTNQYLDSPNTTSTITYKVYGYKPSPASSAFALNTSYGSGSSVVTLWEIAG